ncbi:6826_t:CDS:2 [Cetraspora pellucida]|uniref:6826_t:CDS:1 n=1 Tax=Cetraspora pellucida TaxID=1433469 RepID=A0A9N9A7R3_9GLOM|nr:6826_t:CDS:2 [Cetraspora pellucida]
MNTWFEDPSWHHSSGLIVSRTIVALAKNWKSSISSPVLDYFYAENLDGPALYYCGLRASDIGACLYKIHDNSVRPRNFLGTDNEDSIEAILSDHEGYLLHKFIDSDKPLWPIIDFDLLREVHNGIKSKLMYKEILDTLNHAFRDVCLEIFPKLKNIAQIAIFIELVHKKLLASFQ